MWRRLALPPYKADAQIPKAFHIFDLRPKKHTNAVKNSSRSRKRKTRLCLRRKKPRNKTPSLWSVHSDLSNNTDYSIKQTFSAKIKFLRIELFKSVKI